MTLQNLQYLIHPINKKVNKSPIPVNMQHENVLDMSAALLCVNHDVLLCSPCNIVYIVIQSSTIG